MRDAGFRFSSSPDLQPLYKLLDDDDDSFAGSSSCFCLVLAYAKNKNTHFRNDFLIVMGLQLLVVSRFVFSSPWHRIIFGCGTRNQKSWIALSLVRY